MRTQLALVIVLGACGMEAAGDRPDQLAGKLQAVSQRMHQRYAGARRIEEAIARSDLPRVKSEAHALALLDEPDVLPQWQPYFDAISQSAKQIEIAPDVGAAGVQLATLGLRCAHCHEAAGAKLKLPPYVPPAATASSRPRMIEHHQAALAMWEGLMAPSDERWLAGAKALTTVPLAMVAQAVTPSSPQDVDEVARIRSYATRAQTTGDRTARADLFGKLLGTCAQCHAVLRDR